MTTSTLTDRIVADASAELANHGRILRPEDCRSLKAIADNVARQAGVAPVQSGILPPKVFLSPQPTGWGKTTAIAAIVRQIINDPGLSHVGILIMVNTLAQIPVLIDRMKLMERQYAVRVGKDQSDLNEMGLTGLGKQKWEKEDAHRYAQVLFITQQKLPYLMQYQHDFSKMPFFDYCGPRIPEKKPNGSCGTKRQVRLWDEAYLPVDAVTITFSQVAKFADRLNYLEMPDAAKMLWDWITDVQKRRPEYTRMPYWLTDKKTGAEFDELYKALAKGGWDPKDMLWLQGREVKIERESYNKQVVSISYRRSIPYNIEPLLVFDAGGNDARYRFMKKTENVVELPSAGKTYKNLTIRFFDHPSGKAAYRKKENLEKFAAVVAEAVAEKTPGEKVLVVTRLSDIKTTTPLKKHIRSAVKGSGGDVRRLKFLTWGLHKATNDYKRIKHIILIGLLQLPPKEIIGMVYGTQHKPMHMPKNDADVQTMRMSQIIGDLNQAVGRGATRNMTPEGDVPEGCTVDIIASSHGAMGFSGSCKTLRKMFPGANVGPWLPKTTQTLIPVGQVSSDIFLSRAAESLLGDQQMVLTTTAEWARRAGVGVNTVPRRLKAGHLDPGIKVEVVPGGNGRGGLLLKRHPFSH